MQKQTLFQTASNVFSDLNQITKNYIADNSSVIEYSVIE